MVSDVIYEGAAKIVVPEGVFYNPYARFSRSFGVPILIMESFRRGKGLVVGDLMAATGVRGIRYFLEAGVVSEVCFNDRSRLAYETIKKNIDINHVVATVYNWDVRRLLYSDAMYRLDFIDIDPFGTPSPFIDAAIAAVRDGGIVAFTATDLTALCGLYPLAAFRKYSSLVRKTWFCHEMALRILLKSALDSAGRHDRYVTPIVSIFSEQYARVYLWVKEGRMRYPYDSVGYLVYKPNEYIEVFPLRSLGRDSVVERGSMVIGPIWIGSLHDKEALEYIIDQSLYNNILVPEDRNRVKNLLKLLYGECDMPPYFYDIHVLSSFIGISPPPLDLVIKRLLELGYRVSRTHFTGHGLKTDCLLSDLLGLLRELPR